MIKMRIYRIKCASNFASYIPRDSDIIKRSVAENWGSGEPLSGVMPKLRVERCDLDDPKRKFSIPDYPYRYNINMHMFSQRAVDALDDLLGSNGELIPLDCDDGKFYIYQTLTVIDALGIARSELDYFKDGSVCDIFRYAFHSDRLQKAAVFRRPGSVMRDLVVQPFVDRVNEAKLTGFEFVFVWSDEGIPAPRLDRSERVVNANPDEKKLAAHLH
jgi:hypothetical protein